MESSATPMTALVTQNQDLQQQTHRLYDNWTLWAHLPHDTDWTVKSYKKIMTMDSVESVSYTHLTLPTYREV